MQIKRVVSQI